MCMAIDEADIIEIRRYLELDDKARSSKGISLDDALERRNLAKKYEEVRLLRLLLDELEKLKGDE
jgi:hypothetical protein